ncbi:hypothetical protein DFA_03693 [Cavenderia fasciculata]|uniref:WWE domain-containing protein n=1 Tax=Cavenderia fasciculata TaxID=261658 RepID=F4Q1Q6_CACFS|nr:uncharacterized protein DFA_03693 [Cavenderia fasciculata]EGG18206.1 hypothetical protein DFA_03693 [Cavenderia fasciculata]|eukprot:XP_004357029.1 hypothetical protein DFA_03693 [Cavenderia fasciculata]
MGWIWYWYNDQIWIPFDQKAIDGFEQEHAKGSKTIKVDGQRYLDLTLSYTDIVSNFNSITDKDLIGIQRRYDDPMKRRAVKRTLVADDFFKGIRFCSYQSYLGTSKSSKEYLAIVDEIREYKGKISTSITGKVKVDYVLYSKSDVTPTDEAEFNKYLSAVEGYNSEPVLEEFVAACVKAKKVVDTTPFLVKKKKLAPVKKSSSNLKSAVAAAPVTVAAVAPPTTTTTTSKSKTTTAAPAKDTSSKSKSKKTADGAYFLGESEWMGVCKSDDDVYPMTIKVESVEADTKNAGTSIVNGTIHWPTMSDAITKFKGTLKGHELKMEEYELVQGNDDEIELPNNYEASVYTDEIEGKVDDMTFSLKLTKSPPVSVLRLNSVYKGKATQYDNFKLRIESRDTTTTQIVHGEIEWPDYDNAIAIFKGKVHDNHIEVLKYDEGKVFGPEIAQCPFLIKVSYDDKLKPIFTIELD